MSRAVLGQPPRMGGELAGPPGADADKPLRVAGERAAGQVVAAREPRG